MEIREISLDEYEAALELWHATGDMAGAMIESPEALTRYLKPNHGLSLIAIENEKVIGTILCGHDNGQGQRYQLAVPDSERSDFISKSLLGKALQCLHARGIRCCRLSIPGHPDTKHFWSIVRWESLAGNRDQKAPAKNTSNHPSTEATKPQTEATQPHINHISEATNKKVTPEPVTC